MRRRCEILLSYPECINFKLLDSASSAKSLPLLKSYNLSALRIKPFFSLPFFLFTSPFIHINHLYAMKFFRPVPSFRVNNSNYRIRETTKNLVRNSTTCYFRVSILITRKNRWSSGIFLHAGIKSRLFRDPSDKIDERSLVHPNNEFISRVKYRSISGATNSHGSNVARVRKQNAEHKCVSAIIVGRSMRATWHS